MVVLCLVTYKKVTFDHLDLTLQLVVFFYFMRSTVKMAGISRSSWRSKLSTYFEAHGRFCASHPWEVIVTTVTLTVSALSMSVLSGGKIGTICGVSKPCEQRPANEEVCRVISNTLWFMSRKACMYTKPFSAHHLPRSVLTSLT